MSPAPGLGRTVLELATDSRQFFGDLDKVEARSKTLRGAFDSAKRDLKGFGTEMTSVGKALTVGLSVPLAAIAATSVKAAMDFESSFAGVRKTVNATEVEFAQLATGFRNLAKEIPVNVNELNRIGEAAGQLGIETENILGFTRVMADLGVTTNLSSDQAATSLARLANITGMSQGEFDRLGSTIVALGNNFATTESEIVEMGLRIAGAGKQIGLSEGQILAVGTALSSVGIEAEAGGSAISKVMINIALAVSQGGKELENFAHVAGVSGAEFKRRFEEDAAGALTAFVTGLGRMKEAGGDVLGTLEAMGVTEVRMRDALLRTSGAGDLLTRALELQGEAWEENNALQKEAGERYKTTESQVQLLKNQIHDAQMELGVHLLPVVKSVLENITPLAEKAGDAAEAFGKLPDPAKKVAIAVGLLGIVAGPTAIAVGQLAIALNALAASKGLAILSGFVGKIGAATTATVAFGATLGAVFQDQMMKAVMGGRDLNAIQADFAKVIGLSNKSLLPRFATSIDVVAGNTEKAADATRDATVATRELTAEQKKAIEAQQKLRAQLFGLDDIRKAESYIAALGDTTNWLKLTSDAQEDVRKTLDAAVAAYKASGRAIPDAVKRWYAASRDMRIETGKLADLADTKLNPALAEQHLLFIQSTEGIEYNTGKLADLVDETANFSGLLEGTNVIVGEGVDQMNNWGDAMDDIMERLPDLIIAAVTGGGDVGRSIGALIGKELGEALAKELSEVLADTLGDFLGDMVADLIPGVGTLIGTYIGSLFDSILDAFGQHTEKDIARRIGFELGHEISEGLRDAIAADAKKLFRGGEVEAIAYNLSKIIDEAGGVTAQSVAKWSGELRKLFVYVERGSMTSEQALKSLNETFPKLADAVEKAGGVAAAEFLELIDLAQRFGLESQAITDFLTGQAGKVGGGLAAQLQPLVTKYGDLKEQIAEARKEVEDFDEANAGRELGVEDSQQREEAVARLNKLLAEQKQGAEEAAGAYDRVGLAVLASYNAGIEKGLDQLTLMEQLGSALDYLVVLQKNLGLESNNAAVQELINLRAKIDANKELVTAAQLHGEAYAAMINMGVRDTEVLLSMQEGAVANYDALIAAGFTETEALAQMKDSLEVIRDAHIELGIPISENTQALIDQAEEAGILGEKQVSAEERAAQAMERTADVLERIARKMGVEIPESAEAMARRVSGALETIPREVPIELEWRNTEAPEIRPPYHGGAAGGEGETETMHRGGVVLRAHAGAYIGHHIVEAARAHMGLYVGLKANEVPIIARPGEGVLNDYAGMPALAKWALTLANRGEMPGGTTFGGPTAPIVFQAVVGRKVLAEIVVDDLPAELARRGVVWR